MNVLQANPLNEDELVPEFVVLGLPDWVMLAELPVYARALGIDDEVEVRARVLRTAKYLLEKGLWEAGEVTSDGFRKWPCSSNEAVERVEREWNALNRPLEPGEVSVSVRRVASLTA